MKEESKRTPAKDTLPPRVANAIQEMLWYYWEEQLDAFICDPPERDEEHGFRELVAIDQWFYGHDRSAEEIAEEAENEAVVQPLNTRDE